MEKSTLHGFLDPSLPTLGDETIQELNYQAAKDFAKRSIPGSFIILLALILSTTSTTILSDVPIIIYILYGVLLSSIISRFYILRSLAKLEGKKLTRWRTLFSVMVLATGVVWGTFTAANIYLYEASTPNMVILMFTIGIAGGSAISLFIWQKLAHSYLLVLFLPSYVVSLVYWNNISTIILFAFTVYFIFLYIQIIRSNKEYWHALCNNKLLEKQSYKLKSQAKELKKAKDQAEKSNLAKSEFLSSMSHELRTPLNAILGFTQLLQSDPVHPATPDQAENLDHIYDAGQHLLELVNQVLDLAKIESGKLELQSKPVSISNVINDCKPLIAGMAEKNNITVELTEINDCVVIADYMRLKQVLLNLLSNGIKYNKPNGSLTITTQQLASTVKINVIDTGIGISSKNLQALFTSFSRLGKENSTIEGSGVGLVISKSLVEAMGGQLGMNSVEGEGSTFWIELPLQL